MAGFFIKIYICKYICLVEPPRQRNVLRGLFIRSGMDQQSVRASIIGFNGTLAGKEAKSASELKEAWLLSKAKSSKEDAIDYLIAYKENEVECLRLFIELRGKNG